MQVGSDERNENVKQNENENINSYPDCSAAQVGGGDEALYAIANAGLNQLS